jgi:hypothetical protein
MEEPTFQRHVICPPVLGPRPFAFETTLVAASPDPTKLCRSRGDGNVSRHPSEHLGRETKSTHVLGLRLVFGGAFERRATNCSMKPSGEGHAPSSRRARSEMSVM